VGGRERWRRTAQNVSLEWQALDSHELSVPVGCLPAYKARLPDASHRTAATSAITQAHGAARRSNADQAKTGAAAHRGARAARVDPIEA